MRFGALTSQARLSGAILGVLPVGFFAFLWLTSRDQIEGAFHTPAGIAALIPGLVPRRARVPVDPAPPGDERRGGGCDWARLGSAGVCAARAVLSAGRPMVRDAGSPVRVGPRPPTPSLTAPAEDAAAAAPEERMHRFRPPSHAPRSLAAPAGGSHRRRDRAARAQGIGEPGTAAAPARRRLRDPPTPPPARARLLRRTRGSPCA